MITFKSLFAKLWTLLSVAAWKAGRQLSTKLEGKDIFNEILHPNNVLAFLKSLKQNLVYVINLAQRGHSNIA